MVLWAIQIFWDLSLQRVYILWKEKECPHVNTRDTRIRNDGGKALFIDTQWVGMSLQNHKGSR